MDMNGEQLIEASPETVWDALNDPDILARCITGCDSLSSSGENTFEAVVTSKIGPVKATFKGSVQLSEIDRPNGYVISGEGKGGPAGFAKGGARISLTPKGTSTRLTYTVEAKVGGKIAQIGSKLVDMAAKKMAEEFFTKFCEIVTNDSLGDRNSENPSHIDSPTNQPSGAAEKSNSFKIPTWGWLVGAVICCGLIGFLI